MTEKQIILKIRRGEIDLFEVLVKTYTKKMFYYVKTRVRREDDASDILQNSFIKAYKSLDKFDVNKKFYAYFFSIVKNEIIEFYRHNPNLVYLNEAHEKIEDVQVPEKIDLSFLPPHHKNVLQLLMDGYTYQEIANKLGKSINTIKTLIRRARLKVNEKNNG